MKTIIVTGGAGLIGGNFVHYMLKEHPEDRIICLDALTYAGNLETLAPVMDNPNFRFVKGDIRDRETPLYRRPLHIPRNQYIRHSGADGRLPQIRHRAISSGIYG